MDMDKFFDKFKATTETLKKAIPEMDALLAKAPRELLAKNTDLLRTLAMGSKAVGKTLTASARTKMPKKRGRPELSAAEKAARAAKKAKEVKEKKTAKEAKVKTATKKSVPAKTATKKVIKSATKKPAKTATKKVAVKKAVVSQKKTPKVNLGTPNLPKPTATRKPVPKKAPVVASIVPETPAVVPPADPTPAAHS